MSGNQLFPWALENAHFPKQYMVAKTGTQQGSRAGTWGFHSPSGRQTWGWTGVKLAVLLMAKKESCTAKPLVSHCLRPSPQEGAAFPPSADFPSCTCRDICSPGQVCSALRMLLKGHGFAFLFTCLSRMWCVPRTALLGSPCPTFAPVELKLGVKYFPLSLSGKRLAVTQLPAWEMGITSALFVTIHSK